MGRHWQQWVMAIILSLAGIAAGTKLEKKDTSGFFLTLAALALEMSALISGGFFH